MNAPPLYHHYPRQMEPQPAYLEMDEDGEISADWNGEIGNAVPASVWHNRTLRWDVAPAARDGVVDGWLDGTDEHLAALLARVHAGHTVEWDGNNHVGRLTDDACEASQDAQDYLTALRDHGDIEAAVYRVSEWMGPSTRHVDDAEIVIDGDPTCDIITAATTDEELEAIADGIEAAAGCDGIFLADDVMDWLREERDQLESEAA